MFYQQYLEYDRHLHFDLIFIQLRIDQKNQEYYLELSILEMIKQFVQY